jgi:hypothetical protein
MRLLLGLVALACAVVWSTTVGRLWYVAGPLLIVSMAYAFLVAKPAMRLPDPGNQRVVTSAMLEDLPVVARRYLEHAGVVGRPWVQTVRVRYKGVFRLAADKPWMPIKAEQVYTTDPPGFLWKARLKMLGLWIVKGEDAYVAGRGRMSGKVAGLFTIFDASGPELDQGAMVRFLNEMMWFPSAFLSDYITWRAVDDRSVDVTFTDRGRNVTARLFIDETGRLTDFVTERYREDNGTYKLNTWSTPMREHGRRAGLDLPVKGQALWRLPDGDLVYADLHLVDVEYDLPIEDFWTE